MATTLLDIENHLSINLGENIPPSDAYEKKRRLSWINRGQKHMLGDFYWWFLRRKKGFVVESRIFEVGREVRDIFRVFADPFIYTPEKDFENFSFWIPRGFFKSFRFQEGQITLADNPPLFGIKSVNSLSSRGLIATCYALDHGLRVTDFVYISGANQPQYLGDHEVISADANSFSFRINSPADEATGDINFQRCNVVIDYFTKIPQLQNSTDVTPVPDEYALALADYAEHKFMRTRGKRASAADALEEYNGTLRDMKREHMRQMIFYKNTGNRVTHLCIR